MEAALPAVQLPQVQVNSSIPTEHEMMVYHTMAEQAVTSKMYKGIGEKSGIMMIMLAARELGIPPMQALNRGLNIIQGAVEISARMMNAMIRRAGHSITIKESTDTNCQLVGKRRDNGDTATVSYSFQDAQKAGLVKPTGGWAKCPKDMCFARALSRLARQLFSDVIGIGYVEGEIQQAKEATWQEVEPVAAPNEDDLRQNYFRMFAVEDGELADQYLQQIMKHYSWNATTALEECLKQDLNLIEKFNSWKAKR